MTIDLTATEGPLKGQRFQVEEELLIGRTARGVNLPDPSVSLQHAKVRPSARGFALTDLESATGTSLNGDPVPPNRAMVIEVGDEIRIGDTLFVVGSRRDRMIRIILYSMVPGWILVLAAAVLVFVATGEPSTTLGLSTPVRTHEGRVGELTFPRAYLRTEGLQVGELALRQVTDIDNNGIDEIWLQAQGRERVVTFAADGSWVQLGNFPIGCHVLSNGEGDVQCAGALYRKMGTTYEEVAQTEPVGWLEGFERPPFDGPPEKQPPLPDGGPELLAGQTVAFRLAPGDLARVAGFLAERGITAPVHYILCEGTVPGLPAQALLEDGTARQLSYGCGKDLALGGPRADQYPETRIAALALSAQGRHRLADHVAYTHSGGEHGVFLDPDLHPVVAQLRTPARLTKGALALGLTTTPHVFDPIAKGDLPARLALEADFDRPADVVSARIVEPGDAFLSVGSCGRLQIHAASFRCATLRGCLPGYRFVRVRDIGCEAAPRHIVDSGYTTATWEGSSDALDVRVVVEAAGNPILRDVVSARVAARPRL